MPAHSWRPHAGALLAVLAGPALAQPPPTGTSQQQLVVEGNIADPQTRERFGLLTLTNPEGTCSASMLNDYWAITAAHCVFSSAGTCPQFAANQIQLTANWPRADWPGNTKTVDARQVIALGTPQAARCAMGNARGFDAAGRPTDIALLQVGLHDFGRPDIRERRLNERAPISNSAVLAFGRGRNQLASPVGPTPSSGDGQYRSVEFAITGIQATEYSFFGGDGATIAAGDSGGPTLVEDWDNPLSPRRRLEWRLTGVHSWCETECMPGQTCGAPDPWAWVWRVNRCWDSSIFHVRDAILAAIQQIPPDDAFIGTFPRVPASVLAARRALYAQNIDEPLVAPAGAAIDVQLTFERCHELRVARLAGCPVEPAFEQWSYDANTHQLLHVDSGRCLNISGASTAPNALVILFPCVNAANEKWTVSGSSTWTIRSDHSGLCLHAVPGRRGGGGPLQVSLGTPATLTQMPCDGSPAQQFSNVDADWHRRNGPR
ncbi:RICIN domain-containing protein [Falsiroseomonas oryzae]|uniref:RICIN domain-containing protein n=1 Tax=Falsiroseomonas oryzae TaxID=2766473 RepID=UPI0022EB53EB|nr:RICIN domain-containing protein [Roseomonas sp. MO-31]